MTPAKTFLKATIVVLLIAVSSNARANMILNGSFSSYMTGTKGPGELTSYTTLANWTSGTNVSNGTSTNLLYTPGLADTTGSWATDANAYYKLNGPNNGKNNGFTGASPTGSNFVALDGDTQYRGMLSQTLNGLVANQNYVLNFNWAGSEQYGYSTATQDSLGVTLGTSYQTTATVNNAAAGFTGWMNVSMTFKATGSSEVLSFLASGSPNGVPPFILLSDVSFNAAVPEPSSLILMGGGILAVAGVTYRRRQALLRNG
jgi:hypothetical protein